MTGTTWGAPAAVDAVNKLIRNRRSVFPDQFEPGTVVPDVLVEQLLENANWAPNHKRTEPWRFIVFSGKGLDRLAQFEAARYQETAGAKFRTDKYEKLLKKAPACSHVIAIVMHRNRVVNLPEVEEVAAVACAVENLWLS